MNNDFLNLLSSQALIALATPRRILTLALLLLSFAPPFAIHADEGYGGGLARHGDFRDPASTKSAIFPTEPNHEMHCGAANVATAGNLRHSGTSRLSVYIGATNSARFHRLTSVVP